MHEIADQPIPGCHHTDERGYDPCEPATKTMPYFGSDTFVTDSAVDFGYIPCPCTEATVWALPAHDCWLCLGTGAVVQREQFTYDPCLCEHCAGETYDGDFTGYVDDERADCVTCLGTGYKFEPAKKLSNAQFAQWQAQQHLLSTQRAANEAAAEYYYAIAESQGLLPPAEPPPAEARWQTRIVTLESAERRACGHCVNGWATINGSTRRCTTCDGSGTVAVTRGPWLCSVDVNSAYYEHTSGKLASDRSGVHAQGDLLPGWTLRFGHHDPAHLPTERHVPFHRNDPVTVRPRRAHTVGGEASLVPARSYRTSDGTVHPIECWRDGEYEYYASTDSLLRAKG
jgi:hypothetical protein